MPWLTHDRYCDEIAQQVEQLRAVVTSGADLSATVPTCPDWSLEDLVRHMGGALRWVDALVRARAQENIPWEKVPLGAGPRERGDAVALDRWLADTGELVVGALREAGPHTKVWAWSGVLNAGFWARRMTCEITVHRADATLAAGLPYEVAPDIAADALDEWLQLVEWVQGNTPREAARDLRGPRRSIHLHATDTDPALDAEWLVELGEEGMSWRRGHEKATVALRGPLTEVLLAFYRRLPPDTTGLEVLGDREVLEFWLERTSFG
ncbi:maleylpyruvate isomerase family mycothiol-dependent enzyme [Streptomyces argyrophylli]|uniref:Maleylpyruvate isomerase family mycothiol-dependent enzyme n=1 Tax=Streptomyces argyrophylli TaxID=2726118 RepID=A0A6M4PGU0_9ACTN|nr:maleylpyruvate isomerase family mycothiol-dependent enzyme [Streptomyces argyrophyllae]QJS09719.1 maleylpyruvate isomerase family mycothiol-dependent enzyme [Streptomyces argyrophyllae]